MRWLRCCHPPRDTPRRHCELGEAARVDRNGVGSWRTQSRLPESGFTRRVKKDGISHRKSKFESAMVSHAVGLPMCRNDSFIGAHSPADRFQGSAARTPPGIVSRLQFFSFEQSFPRLAGRGSRSKSKPQRRSSAPSIATFNLRRIRPPPLIQHRIWRRRPVSMTRGLPKREDLPERTAGGT